MTQCKIISLNKIAKFKIILTNNYFRSKKVINQKTKNENEILNDKIA